MTSALPFPLPAALEERLRAAYASPPRAYHNFAHVDEVLAHFQSVPNWHDPVSVALAILFHDAVYHAGRSDNEAQSARLMRDTVRETPLPIACDLTRAEALILLTARHGSLGAESFDQDTAHFLDCDMAILGAPPARYQLYEQQIAAEYAALPAPVYRAGRARFVRKLLASPRIYLSDTFHTRLEQRARENLSTSLASSPAPGDG
jgi:predicted metal-dependent HD superfamily phosphohydrolase